MFELLGTAAEGVALDPLTPSANPGQIITVTGASLSTTVFALFSAIDADGTLTTVESRLFGVSADGTQASVTVPVTAVTGLVPLRPEGGVASSDTVFLQIVPTLASLSVPAGEVLQPCV